MNLFQKEFGQFDGVDAAFADFAPQIRGGHVGPSFAHAHPRFCQPSGKAAHGQSRPVAHIGAYGT